MKKYSIIAIAVVVLALLICAPSACHGAVCIGSDTVTLSWDASTDPESGISHYELWRGASDLDRVMIAEPTGLTYTDTPPDGKFFYWAKAVNNCGLKSGFSVPSEQVTIDHSAPDAPKNIRVQIP